MPKPTRTKLTPPQIALEYRVKPQTVLDWIRAGELRAIDVAKPGSRRPRFRIDPADLLAFEQRRLAGPTPKPQRRHRKDPAVVEFF